MSVDIGDAVLTFLGDTTQLDTAFDKVASDGVNKLQPTNAELQRMTGNWQATGAAAVEAGAEGEIAGEQVAEGARLAGRELREAKGEAGLLGEQFGIHLPRHVRSFIAEMPGVGSALSAAFAATAVLFLLEALVKVTEKVSDAAGAFLYNADAAKKSNESVAETNKRFLELAATAAKDQQALENFGKSALELADNKIAKLNDRLKESITLQHSLETQAKSTQFQYSTWDGIIDGVVSRFTNASPRLAKALEEQANAVRDAQAKAAAEIKNQENIRKEAQLAQQQRDELAKQLTIKRMEVEIEASKKVLLSLASDDEDKYLIERATLNRRIALAKMGGEQTKNQVIQLNAELEALNNQHYNKEAENFIKLQNALGKTLDDVKKTVQASNGIDIVLPANVERILRMRNAAQSLGITLKSDLVQALDQATKAEKAFLEAGGKNEAELLQFRSRVEDAQKALDNFGKVEATMLGKQGPLWRLYEQDVQHAADKTKFFGDVGKETFNGFTQASGQAFAAFISGQASFGEAMMQAAASTIDALAAQAFAQALYWTGMGIADLYFNPGRSAEDFAAAEVFGAVAALAGAAGFGLGLGGRGGSGGGGGSSSSTRAGNNSLSNAAQQPGQSQVAVVGVQHFATGGLISKPTLAIVGEGSKQEAVLPLEDPKAMARIGEAIAKATGGGGGPTLNVTVQGHVIGANDVAHLTEQISKRVRKGQATLHASNTFRVTKRSA